MIVSKSQTHSPNTDAAEKYRRPERLVVQPNVADCALAFEGGGYRGSFSAGFANVLLAARISFPYVCGVSAGASNAVNYASQDRVRTREAFMTDGAARSMVGLRSVARGNGYFDADSLYEGAVESGVMPFAWDSFVENGAEVKVQAFRRDDGATLRFGKADVDGALRLMDVVRASSTLPGEMRPRAVDGRILYDGGLGDGAGLPVCIAEDDGWDRILLVTTRPRGYRKQPPTRGEVRMYERLAGDHAAMMDALMSRWSRYNAELERIEELERAGRILVVRPERMLVSSGTVNARQLREQYEIGRTQAIREMGRIRKFLFGSRDAGPEPEAGWDGYVTIG